MRPIASLAALAIGIAVPGIASAQDAPAATTPAAAPAAQELKGPSAGATVYGPSGQPAGTIESIDGTNAVFSTGTNKMTVPLDKFGKGPNGPTIGLEKAQLDAMATQASAQSGAQLRAQLTPGTSVKGKEGAVVGTVKTADASTVTVAAAEGGKEVRVPVNAFAPGADGPVLNMTAQEFGAAVASTAGSTPSK